MNLGGLAFGLYLVGFLLARIVPAKTLFLVSFTESTFMQSTNSLTNFEKEGIDNLRGGGGAGGESTVRPLRAGKGTTYSTPKMQLLSKVGRMCNNDDDLEILNKEDADVMWNEFFRFRQRIKYNLMCIILCCCTRSQRNKADSELYKQLLLESSESKLERALDVRSILRTNKYLKLLLNASLNRSAQFLIRN